VLNIDESLDDDTMVLWMLEKQQQQQEEDGIEAAAVGGYCFLSVYVYGSVSVSV